MAKNSVSYSASHLCSVSFAHMHTWCSFSIDLIPKVRKNLMESGLGSRQAGEPLETPLQ